MNNWMYSLYALVLGVVAFFTGEIVTFVMLGFILIALININTTLKKLLKKDAERSCEIGAVPKSGHRKER
ncbi:MAG TPA: hypothetical protein VK142_06480 [Bacillota bacterium]|nr:hypothetical protein [Bacillota bacterium]